MDIRQGVSPGTFLTPTKNQLSKIALTRICFKISTQNDSKSSFFKCRFLGNYWEPPSLKSIRKKSKLKNSPENWVLGHNDFLHADFSLFTAYKMKLPLFFLVTIQVFLLSERPGKMGEMGACYFKLSSVGGGSSFLEGNFSYWQLRKLGFSGGFFIPRFFNTFCD